MRAAAALLFLCVACGESDRSTPSDAGTFSDADVVSDAGILPEDGGTNPEPDGLDLLPRLAGLWSGPATRTPLGDFRMMNVDFAAASDQFVFARVDLDAENALRFGFSVETHGGADVLTYRNGGYFLGLLRDDRTQLVEHDASAETYRFCHVDRGCDYIDAVYDFEGPDRVVFDVFVRGNQHVYWDARRIEAGALPPKFTDNLATQGTGDAPFPAMPSLRMNIVFPSALATETPVWLVLSRSDCSITGGCKISRHIRAIAAAGSNSAEIILDQLHAGEYRALAVIDRNHNLETIGTPDSGDGISIPNTRLTIGENGETSSSLNIAVNIP